MIAAATKITGLQPEIEMFKFELFIFFLVLKIM